MIKNENKPADKKNEEYFEWLAWPIDKWNNFTCPSKDEIIQKKKQDYAINLIPINEENQKTSQPPTRLIDKLNNLNEIKFKNSFVRRNSPKKLFQPLSTLTEETKEINGQNFNSLQEIPLPVILAAPTKQTSDDMLNSGEISPKNFQIKSKK